MRVITMSEFGAIPGGRLAAVDEVLQVTVNRIVIGYFVPPEVWLDMVARLERAALEGEDA